MSPNNHAERFAPAARSWRVGTLASALSLAVLGCSVYDSSLVAGMQALPSNGAAGGDSGSDAGGGLTSTGGDTLQAGAPAASGSSGEPAVAGDANGGSAGAAGAIEGSSGAPASAGTSAVGGGGGTSAAGSAGGGSAGVAGSAPMTVELAHGKTATSSSQETGNEPAKGNDGSATTRWCAIDDTFPQWWRVDLAATHHVSQVVVQFEHPERKYYYVIETSLNDSVYAQQATVSGTGAVQTVDLPNNPSARYVRITVTNGVPYLDKTSGTTYPTWASFWEIALNGT
jgi:F5/8 type C domain